MKITLFALFGSGIQNYKFREHEDMIDEKTWNTKKSVKHFSDKTLKCLLVPFPLALTCFIYSTLPYSLYTQFLRLLLYKQCSFSFCRDKLMGTVN